jgi:2-polyprenyl-6-methoxyphenol hydroxylase-like FAD-dependent oxidoreductase
MLETSVLIAGRGPVGMTLALQLANHGVDCVLVDPVGWLPLQGSKALCMQRESMEILSRTGCGRTMAERGVAWPIGRTYYRQREIAQIRFEPYAGPGFPPMVNFPQHDTEALLLRRLRGVPRVQAYFSHRLTEFRQDAAGVDALLDGPGGPIRCRADYIVGCDGSRSTVRKQMGVEFRGKSYLTHFLICDIRANLPYPDERRLYFDPPFNRGRTVLVHPCPESVWHIDWQVGDRPLDVDQERRSGRIDARVRAIVGGGNYEVLWVTTYAFRSLIADRMRLGRAFLAGDAAHLVSPYGARGLNSGLADADNLAWKLAYVSKGAAPASLLDSYHVERHAAALENLHITDTTAQFMAPQTWARRIWRKAILAASSRVSGARRFVNAGRFYQPATYAESPVLACTGARRRRADTPVATSCLPAGGIVAPDASCAVEGSPGISRLRDFIGQEFLALIFSESVRAAAETAEEAISSWPARLPRCQMLIVTVGPAAARANDPAPAGSIHVADHDGDLARAYSVKGLGGRLHAYLIRPDGYIVGCWSPDTPSSFADWVCFALGQAPQPEASSRLATYEQRGPT